MIGAKPWRIRLNKVHGFIKIDDSLPLEKTFTFPNVMIVIKLAFNMN